MSTGRVGVRGGGRSIIDRSLSYSSSPPALLRSSVSSVTLPSSSSSSLSPQSINHHRHIYHQQHLNEYELPLRLNFLRVNQLWCWHCGCNGILIIWSKCGIKRKLQAPATWWKLVRKREIVVERIKLLMLLPNGCWGNIWQLVQAFLLSLAKMTTCYWELHERNDIFLRGQKYFGLKVSSEMVPVCLRSLRQGLPKG